jgi:pyruvate/2-oxoglutarate dehydrogenase complex dihydrolipoamide dehydrogenase (E3) component
VAVGRSQDGGRRRFRRDHPEYVEPAAFPLRASRGERRGGRHDAAVTRVVIVGSGPAGYEAALVAAQLGAQVTIIERDGVGGACVLTDCVPSKTLIASAEAIARFGGAEALGVRLPHGVHSEQATVDLPVLNRRVKGLARAQSRDVAARLAREGVDVVEGSARLDGPGRVALSAAGCTSLLDADVALIATGALPRTLGDAPLDGERVLSWRQLYDLEEPPERLIVVGSGVTGAEFASAYQAMGVPVTLVSSRDRVMPGEDEDAALLLEQVFRRRGMTILGRSRAAAVRAGRTGVRVTLTDGRSIEGSHCLLAVGSVPNTVDLGLPSVGIAVGESGVVSVDRVSRTGAPGVYAAGDVTGVWPLASVAAMQGRTAMWHALGEAVTPLRLSTVAATVFTDPEIATVGMTAAAAAAAGSAVRSVTLPLATNARAKMRGVTEGFVKLHSRAGTGTVLGGVVVAPGASELILPLSIAVQNALTVAQFALSFAVYPSDAGSLTEAARLLMEESPH